MNFQTNSMNSKQIHHQLYLLMSREMPQSFSEYGLMQDCWVIMDRLKVLIFQYFNSATIPGQQVNIQRLYEHVNQNFFKLKHYYSILTIDMFMDMHNFFEIVILPIVEYYVKQWNTLSSSNIVDNVYEIYSDQFSQCLCAQQCNLPERAFASNKICYRCGQIYHSLCFQANDQLYQCPFCFLKYCLPDRQVIEVFFKGYLPPVEQNKSTMSIIELDWPLAEISSNNLSVELRCVRISKQNNHQQTWPQHCDIYLDDSISMSFKPLPDNSPLKRRHDNPIIVSLGDLANSQKIKINQFYVNGSFWHLIVAFVVIQKNQSQIFHSIISNPNCQIDETQSRAYMNKLFSRSKSLQAQKLKISNKCQFYSSKIEYPCRSRHCTTHYQPFDLRSLICSSIQAKSSIKRWKCPICGVRAYDIVRDVYLEKMIGKQNSKNQFQFYYENEENSQDSILFIK